MSMLPIYTILLCAVAMYAANAAGSFHGGIKGFSRGAQVLRGIQVFEHIIKDAKFMFRSAFGEKVYLRSGGYTQARADFYASDPKQIRDISVGHGKQGSVGDKTIQLYKPDGFISKPTLVIESKRGNFPDVRVIYED